VDSDGELQYTHTFPAHYIIPDKQFVCLRYWDRPCPVCDYLDTKELKSGGFREARLLRPKLRNLYNVIVHDSLSSTIRILDISNWLMQKNLETLFKEFSPRPELSSTTPSFKETMNYLMALQDHLTDKKDFQNKCAVLRTNDIAFVRENEGRRLLYLHFRFVESPTPYSLKLTDDTFNLENILEEPDFEEVYIILKNYLQDSCK